MMKAVYLITIEDINTTVNGHNIIINTTEGNFINFTQEAFDEFARDVQNLRDNGYLRPRDEISAEIAQHIK